MARLTLTSPSSTHHVPSARLSPFFLVFFSLGGSPPVWKRDAGFFFFSDLMGLVLESELSSSSLLVVAGKGTQGTPSHSTRSCQLRVMPGAVGLAATPRAHPIPFFLLFFSFFSPFTWNMDIGSFLVLLADLALPSGSLLSPGGTGELRGSQRGEPGRGQEGW